LWEAAPAAATWQGTPDDSRYRTKDWLDTYANVDHTWITKNDGVTAASFAVIFSHPPYYLRHEFRAAANPVQGLYVIDHPTSTPLYGTQGIYGYDESVPIHIYTVDSSACSGDPLSWAMAKELRYIAETYDEGSYRAVETMQGQPEQLGSMTLYHITCTLSYRRGLT
jgi:hypothetical protein